MIGDRIKKIRVFKNMTQEELIEGIASIAYLSKVENGQSLPSRQFIEEIAGRLGLNADTLSSPFIPSENEEKIKEIFYNYWGKKILNDRDITLIKLYSGELQNTGIRVNELSSLRIKDLDFSGCEISVIRKGGKKDTVSVPPSSLNDIECYLKVRKEKYGASDSDNEFVFVKRLKGRSEPLTNRAIENIVYKYTKSFDKRMSPHKLRHTYATNLAEQTGGDIPLIMNQLGHTNSDISLLYINTSREKQRQAAERLDDRRNKKRQ